MAGGIGMSYWSFAASTPVMVVGLLLLGLAGWLFYAQLTRGGQRKGVLILETLRFLLIILLLVTLMRPEFVRQLERNELPEVAVLYDASGSMETRDIPVEEGTISRGEWVQERLAAEFWRPLEGKARVVVEDFSARPAGAEAARHGTDLNAALATVFQRRQQLKSVLLLTDGDWNQGQSPVRIATRFRENAIPIYSVGVGQETPLPDLALTHVAAPSYGLFGEQISIPFKVENHLPREVRTTVMLLEGDREETRKEIVIPPMGELQDSIVWSPRSEGEKALTLRLPVEPEEMLPDNNERDFLISVRVETLKVLLVDSYPRWEYRFLRNALERDPGVEMHCLLLHPELGPGGGRHYLSSFPGGKEQIARYDVIFLGDVGIGENELSESDAELIRGLVEQQSSGLVFLPGRRGRQLTFLESPLKDLLPVVLDTNRPQGIPLQNENALHLSTMGRNHFLTRFDSDEQRNEDIWRYLPGFYWSAAVEKSRPGSEVLAVHASLRNSWGRIPLVVTRSFGSGKVLFMGTDSAWRWRRGVEDMFHYRFWSQVVRWMAHQRHLAQREGIRLAYSPESPHTGDTVFLQAVVLNNAGFPVDEGPVVGLITAPSGRKERVEFSSVEQGWGVFKSSFRPQEGGAYEIYLGAETHGRHLETRLMVLQPEVEKIGQPVNAGILQEIAEITGGATGPVDYLDRIVQQIALLPEPKPIEQRVRLWSDPWWGGFILLLLSVYWAGRKWMGLI
jgi:hypothetical protein